jgi:hypothetical protein
MIVPLPPPIEATASASVSKPSPLSSTVNAAAGVCAGTGMAATNRHASNVVRISLTMDPK